MRVLAFLASAVLASSRPPRENEAHKEKVAAFRARANTCAEQKTVCVHKRGCVCHATKTGQRCVVHEDKKSTAKSGQVGNCIDKKVACNKRKVVNGECAGRNCMANANKKRCMMRPDKCKKSIRNLCKGWRYGLMNNKSYCCKFCYRKQRGQPCLDGFVAKKTSKKQGDDKLSRTWDPKDRHMADASTKLCCRTDESSISDECASNPCNNGGTCNDGPRSFTCTCAPGFEGETCDINIDECATANCNNGTCIDGINTYTCSCDPGYSGSNCENVDDYCIALGADCGHRLCMNLAAGYNCVDPCPDNCNGNGTCSYDNIPTDYNPTCHCNNGYSGSACEVVDHCITMGASCGHRNCLNLASGYNCVDPCPNDCFGNGTCVYDSAYTPSCNCGPNYMGEYCNVINYCNLYGIICEAGQTCVSHAGGNTTCE